MLWADEVLSHNIPSIPNLPENSPIGSDISHGGNCLSLSGTPYLNMIVATQNESIHSDLPTPIASAESSVELIHKAILENGFYFSKDATVGERVEKIDEDATPFASAGSLHFCKANVLDNPVSIIRVASI